VIIFVNADGGRYAGQIEVVGGSGVFLGFFNFHDLCLAAIGLPTYTRLI
jgi:hypothetical protein